MILGSFIILILAASLFANMVLSKQADSLVINLDGPNLSKSMATTIKVEARDKAGNLKQTVVKENDLILTNFAVWIASAFIQVASAGATPTGLQQIKNTAGSNVNFFCRGPTPSSTLWGQATAYTRYTYLRVGTGGGSATISDYNLNTAAENFVQVGAATITSNNVTFSTATTATTTETINEAGVFIQDGRAGGYMFMMIHDTFTGIPVVATDTVTVTYTITSGSGFTANWVDLIAGCFYPVKDYGTAAITYTMEDDTGGARTIVVLDDGDSSNWLFDTNNFPFEQGMKIGTGTTAPALSDYNVETPVESYTVTQQPVMQANINFTIAAVFTCASSRTITEAGFFTVAKDSGGTTRNIMMWRDTFAGVTIDAGRQVTINFIVYFNV